MAALALEGAITHALAVLALLILWLCWSWRRHAKDRSDSTKAELRQRELRQEVCQLQARVQHLEQELQDSQRRAVEAEAKWVAEKDLQRLKERTEVPQELERVHELPPEVSLQALEKAKELMCQNLEMKARIQALEQELRWSTRPRSRGPPGADIKMNGTQADLAIAGGACEVSHMEQMHDDARHLDVAPNLRDKSVERKISGRNEWSRADALHAVRGGGSLGLHQQQAGHVAGRLPALPVPLEVRKDLPHVSECGAYGAGQTLDGCDGGSDGVTSPGEELQLDVDSEGSCSRASSIYSAYPRGRALKRLLRWWGRTSWGKEERTS
eukprot:g31318.t1